jgi:multidrug efflux pump subunit AcrB
MITLLCVYTLKVAKSEKQDGTIFDKLSIYYKQALVTSLRNPFSTITIILVLFVSSIFLLQFVPNIFMAKSDRALITVNVELPLGTSIDKTQAVISDI